MSQHRIPAIGAAAVLVLLGVVPVLAGAPGTTTITLDSSSAGESFTATGDVICDSGTATTDFHHFGGSQNGAAGSFHLTKTLVCEDGSGSFTILVNAATVFGSPTDQGGWAVLSGTGDYSGLTGGGKLVGTYYEGGIVDLYTGVLHN